MHICVHQKRSQENRDELPTKLELIDSEKSNKALDILELE
jgi:hypothetical protein